MAVIEPDGPFNVNSVTLGSVVRTCRVAQSGQE